MRSNLSRILVTLVAVPALVSLAVTLVVLMIWGSAASSGAQPIVLPTHSATSMLPPRSSETAGDSTSADSGNAPSGDSGDSGNTAGTTAPCENPVHGVQAGETLGVIADQFGVTTDDITAMNVLLDPSFNPDFLSIGQEIVIPLCGIPEAPPPTFTLAATRVIPTPISTSTEPPAGTTAVQIVGVFNPGDVTKEAVELVNQGSPIDLAGWTLSSKRGDGFVFPTFRLFSGGGVTIYTGIGENTPIALYWGLTKAIWRSGDTVSLFDDEGTLQTEYVVP